MIAGTNHDEYRAFVAEEYDGTGNPIDTSAEYAAAVLALWTSRLESSVLSEYPYDSYLNGGLALSASGTDGVFSCPARNADKLLSKYTTTYAYEFNDENAPPGTIPGLSFPLGAFHGAEIQYLMLVTGAIFPLTTDQQTLSNTMISYWTRVRQNAQPKLVRPAGVGALRPVCRSVPVVGATDTYARDQLQYLSQLRLVLEPVLSEGCTAAAFFLLDHED